VGADHKLKIANVEVVRKAALARELGYGFTCSMCAKLWRNMERGVQAGCEAATSKRECGGPVVGKPFPLYEGPLSDSAHAAHCFCCGKPGEHGDRSVEVEGSRRRFLLCSEHQWLLKSSEVKRLEVKV
jgi:hypothetical protein